MDEFRLHIKSVDPDNMNKYGIWGVIYAEINGHCFPDDMWYDAVDSVILMWLIETINHISGKQKRWEFPFMDGPYLIRLAESSEEKISVTFISHDGKEVNSVVTERYEAIGELLRCVNAFLDICYQNAPNSTNNHTFLEILNKRNVLKRMQGQRDGLSNPC